MPGWLSALIAVFRAWLGIRASIQQKQQEHVGKVEQQNADLTEELKEKAHEVDVFTAPARPESAVDADLLRHAREQADN